MRGRIARTEGTLFIVAKGLNSDNTKYGWVRILLVSYRPYIPENLPTYRIVIQAAVTPIYACPTCAYQAENHAVNVSYRPLNKVLLSSELSNTKEDSRTLRYEIPNKHRCG